MPKHARILALALAVLASTGCQAPGKRTAADPRARSNSVVVVEDPATARKLTIHHPRQGKTVADATRIDGDLVR